MTKISSRGIRQPEKFKKLSAKRKFKKLSAKRKFKKLSAKGKFKKLSAKRKSRKGLYPKLFGVISGKKGMTFHFHFAVLCSRLSYLCLFSQSVSLCDRMASYITTDNKYEYLE